MENNQRDFKGVWIDKEIWLDKRLNALEKVIYTEIDSLDNGENGCFASNEYLANFCQCSQRKISEAISKLIELDYIELKSFDGRQRVLRSRVAKSARQNNKKCEADTQNLRHNNIVNNEVDYNKKENIKEKEPKLTFGEYKHVKLTDDEYQKLNNDYGLIMAEKLITYLDEYIEEKGYKSKSHYLAIKRWVVDAVNKKNKPTVNKQPTLLERINSL